MTFLQQTPSARHDRAASVWPQGRRPGPSSGSLSANPVDGLAAQGDLTAAGLLDTSRLHTDGLAGRVRDPAAGFLGGLRQVASGALRPRRRLLAHDLLDGVSDGPRGFL